MGLLDSILKPKPSQEPEDDIKPRKRKNILETDILDTETKVEDFILLYANADLIFGPKAKRKTMFDD